MKDIFAKAGVRMTVSENQTFDLIYRKYRRLCEHVAFALLKDHALAEDAVHNAFEAVAKHKEILALPPDKLKSKIVIITKNKAIDILRARSKMQPEPEETADDFDLPTAIENKEAYENMLGCIGKLPQLYRTAFEMRYVKDLNNQEIAELLGTNNKTVSARIARAKVMLRGMLETDGVVV
jgi:RNA polymerase sigma-70 factor (ECF subfamily)